jgi:hypothetical protein
MLPSRIVAFAQHFRVRARDFYFEDWMIWAVDALPNHKTIHT